MTRARWFAFGALSLLLLGAGQLGSVVTSAPIYGRGTAQDPIRVVGLSTSGNATTATSLAANGTNCSAGQFAAGVDQSGNAEGCAAASFTESDPQVDSLSANGWCRANDRGVAVNCTTASLPAPTSINLTPAPTTCSASQAATGINADGSAAGCWSPLASLPVAGASSLGAIKGDGIDTFCQEGEYQDGFNPVSGAMSCSAPISVTCASTGALLSRSTCTGPLVHIAGTETVTGAKTFSEEITLLPASGTTGLVHAGARTSDYTAAGFNLHLRGGPGTTEIVGVYNPTAGGTTTIFGGSGGASSGGQPGGTGGYTLVAGGAGGSGYESSELPGAGGALYLTGGSPGAGTAEGTINGAHVYLDTGPTYNAGGLATAGSIYVCSQRPCTAVEFHSPVVLGETGTAISGSFRGSTTWDMPSTSVGACASTTITVTGAVEGADVALGLPALTTVTCNGRVSGADTVTLLCCCVGASTCNPGSLTYYARAFNP